MATGTCISDTFWHVNNKQDKNLLIIHAIVERRGDKLRHPHAVVYNRKEGNIYEVSNSFKDKPIKMPFKLWISLGKATNIKLYELEEFRKILLETKTWDFYHL